MQDPEIIIYQQHYYKPLIDKANRLTEEYVSKHKLVLTGGMAIDLALRAKGDNIYDDDAIPDYDIISDQNIHHAHELAKIMCNEGIPDVNVINAIHITTVRVRVKNMTFLDATYVPSNCFEKIPYLDIGHLRVVHPHYQFIDQRLSLSNLMQDTGISLNIFNRLIKDISRNNLLRSYYPIEANVVKPKMRTIRVPIDFIAMKESELQSLEEDTFIYQGNVCLAGYVAIALLLNNFKIKDDAIELSIPESAPIRVLTCNIDSHKLKRPKTFRPLLNLRPVTLLDGDYEYLDTYGSRIGCNKITIKKNISVCIASVDYLLMELLRDRIYISEEPFTSTYLSLCAMTDKKRNEDSDMIWFPSINCYGYEDLPEYKVNALEKIMSDAHQDTDSQESNNEVAKNLKPKNVYLYRPKCKTKLEFSPEDSHYFRIDGTEDSAIVHTNYKYITDQFEEFVNSRH